MGKQYPHLKLHTSEIDNLMYGNFLPKLSLRIFIRINLLFFSWVPLINFVIFIYWFPLLICLIGVRYTDFSQLVPIVLQLVFLTSPILYRKDNLGNLDWITNYNPIYKILDPLRMSIIEGQIDYRIAILTLFLNLVGLLCSLILLHKQSKKLPFLV